VKALFQAIVFLLLSPLGFMLMMTVSELPLYGLKERPTNNYVMERYLEKGFEEVGGRNLVANIVIEYRGYDTMVEVTVLYTAVIAIFLTLKTAKEAAGKERS